LQDALELELRLDAEMLAAEALALVAFNSV
jgi:hypothetical protein